jgi:hypothetical protein
MRELKIELARISVFSLQKSVVLEMPATQSELIDALQKARVADAHACSFKLLDCKQDWLKSHIPEKADLYELNLLATRMERHIQDDLDIFEAMVKIEANRNKGEPIPVHRLINLTFSLDNCHIAGDILSDALLGKFLYENNFLTDEDADAVQERMDSGQPVSEFLSMLGQDYRESQGGVLTGSGRYVEWDGSVHEGYVLGETAYIDRSGAPVVLELSKDGKNAVVELPAPTSERFDDASAAVGARNPGECAYVCKDCLIPSAKTLIDGAEDLEAVQRFAKALADMEQRGGVVEYKALLEAAGCKDLGAALGLADEIGEYRIETGYSDAEEYAWAIFAKTLPKGVDEELLHHIDFYSYGKALMERNHVAETSYGLLSRKDGGPILSHPDTPVTGMGMCVEIRP